MDWEWLKEENWATDLMADVARNWIMPKEEKQDTTLGEDATGAKVEFSDWTIVLTGIGIVAVIGAFLFFGLKSG